MKRVTVIGAEGFVGSAFVRLLEQRSDVELIRVTRRNFEELAGTKSDVVVEAACNSKKYLADQNPVAEFEASVTHRLNTLLRFPAEFHLHISSVDVYSDLSSPVTTREDSAIDLTKVSRYGLHKLLAEQLVQSYAPKWLIVRLAGMVGPGLRKNPVFDILNNQPLRVHPGSSFQYMHTDEVAGICWSLVERNICQQIFNVCGDGVVTMTEIAAWAGKSMDLSQLPPSAAPRILEASTEKLRRYAGITHSRNAVEEFVRPRLQAESPQQTASRPKGGS